MLRAKADWLGNIAVFVLVIVMNALANIVPLGGKTTGEVSELYPSLFTPAGFTFSIWGLIYTTLLVFVIYQALPAQRNNTSIKKISGFFQLNCIANAAWILAWHFQLMWLSIAIMAVILVTLVSIYRSLDVARPAASLAHKFAVQLPFSLYTAWICVATIANISALQTGMDWDNALTNEITWTLLKLAVAGAIGVTVFQRSGDIAFILVVAWAAYGIAIGQIAEPQVSGAAISLVMLTLILVVVEIFRRVRIRA